VSDGSFIKQNDKKTAYAAVLLSVGDTRSFFIFQFCKSFRRSHLLSGALLQSETLIN